MIWIPFLTAGRDSPVLALPGAALTETKSKSQAKTWREKWKGQIPFLGIMQQSLFLLKPWWSYLFTLTLREDYFFFNCVQRAGCEVKEIMARSVALHPHAPVLTVSYFIRSAVFYVKVLAAPLTWSERSLISTTVARFKPLCKQVLLRRI